MEKLVLPAGSTSAMNILAVQKFPVWRDSHLKIEGKALYKLQAIFLEDWLYASSGLNTYSWEQFMNRQYFPGKKFQVQKVLCKL